MGALVSRFGIVGCKNVFKFRMVCILKPLGIGSSGKGFGIVSMLPSGLRFESCGVNNFIGHISSVKS